MKHAFNIYPALLVITPVDVQESSLPEGEWPADSDQSLANCPQTYWGDCVCNEKYTQLMFTVKGKTEACLVQELIEGKVDVLQPVKFKGNRFLITFIPVSN